MGLAGVGELQVQLLSAQPSAGPAMCGVSMTSPGALQHQGRVLRQTLRGEETERM